MLRRLLLGGIVLALLALAAGVVWDFGYARQLRDLHDDFMEELDLEAVRRGDPSATAFAAMLVGQGPPVRGAAMQELARVTPPWWKRATHAELQESLTHWQELEPATILARLGDAPDEVMARLDPQLDQLVEQVMAMLPVLPQQGDPKQLVRAVARDFIEQAFARYPDYQRARAESELIYRRAVRVYGVF